MILLRLLSSLAALGLPSGEELKTKGWKEAARCDDGHSWAYLMEKGSERRLCRGINARGGATEEACMPYEASLKVFKERAAELGKRKACWESFPKEQKSSQKKSQLNFS